MSTDPVEPAFNILRQQTYDWESYRTYPDLQRQLNLPSNGRDLFSLVFPGRMSGAVPLRFVVDSLTFSRHSKEFAGKLDLQSPGQCLDQHWDPVVILPRDEDPDTWKWLIIAIYDPL